MELLSLTRNSSHGGRGRGGEKKKKYKNYRFLQAIKNNKPSLLIPPVLPVPHSGRVKEKRPFVKWKFICEGTQSREAQQPHSEPGQHFQPSHFPNTSWYILKYFNFSALSSALSCLISCAWDFFGSALDNIQERVALTCTKADFYNVNLKGEVKTTPKKKKNQQPILKKTTLNHFKGRGGGEKNQDAFWCKVRVCG